jgi:polyisoprenoid-binding protein YceI
MRNIIFMLLLPLAVTNTAYAHHAFAADYEAGKEGVVEGTITEVIYRNPHARYYIDVITADGGKETWDLQTMNLMMLGRVGWKKDTLQVGDKIKVEGILGRNNTRRMSINVVTHEDGRVISPQRGITESNADLIARDSSDDEAAGRNFLSLASNISAGRYELEEDHAYLGFSYSHMGLSKPQLQFSDFEAILELDGNNMGVSTVTIRVDASSITTATPALDEVLRSADFLDVANHPEILFTSTRYEESSDSNGTLSGELTIAGVTRPVSLDVTINAAAMNQMNRREMIGFAAAGDISRSDFGMAGFEKLVGDQLSLNIQVEFQKSRQANNTSENIR